MHERVPKNPDFSQSSQTKLWQAPETLPINGQEMIDRLSQLEKEIDGLNAVEKVTALKNLEELSSHLELLEKENKRLYVNPQGEASFHETNDKISHLFALIDQIKAKKQ